MNVLVLAANDSDNLMIENILRELKRRGHCLRIFARLMDKKSTRMFDGIADRIRPTSELASADIRWCDCIFTCLRAALQIDDKYFSKKYFFVYNNYIDNTWFTPGADFMFACGMSRHMSHWEDCASMPIGNPKNDTPQLGTTPEDKNRILFIDSGHYPFSHTGKVQVAEMLLSICRKFPDHTLVIKPRFLPDDNVLTSNHSNYDHIYALIEERCGGSIPQNLVMPNEHLDMQKEIDKSSCVIMLCTSAYVDVAMRGKKMLIVEGLDNEDKFELRNGIEYKNIYDLRRKSGCVVNYKDVLHHLPEGLPCKAEHLENVAPYPDGASKRAVDVMEHIHEHFLKKGLFPKIRQYRYESYATEMVADKSLNWNTMLHLRLKNIGIEKLNFFNRIVADVDISSYTNFICTQHTAYPTTKAGLSDFLAKLTELQHGIVLENAQKLMDDALNQAVLLKALYQTKRYCELCAINEADILCKGPWHYYMGMLNFMDGADMQQAAYHMVQFLKEAFSRSFRKYECEMWYGIRDAVFRIIRCYRKDASFLSAADMLHIFIQLCERNLVMQLAYQERVNLFSVMRSMQETALASCDGELCAKAFSCYMRSHRLADDNARAELNALRKKRMVKIAERMSFAAQQLRRLLGKIRRDGIADAAKAVARRLKSKLHGLCVGDLRKNAYCITKILVGYTEYKKLIKEFGADAYLYLTAGGTGDVYISNQFYNGYIKNLNQEANAVMVLPGKSVFQTTQLFKINRTKELKREEWESILHLLRFMGNEAIHTDMLYYHIFTVYTGYVTWLESYKGWNLYRLIKAIHFDNVLPEQQESPSFDYDSDETETLFCRNNMIPNRTVILSPYARWTKPIDGLFWKRLTVTLKEHGYTVCTNSIGESEPAIEGTVSVNYSYRVSVPVIEKAGFFIGLRSGFCDIVESATAKKVALYPHNCHKRGIANGTTMGSFSLNEMFGRNNWLELETTPATFSQVISNIIAYFDS